MPGEVPGERGRMSDSPDALPETWAEVPDEEQQAEEQSAAGAQTDPEGETQPEEPSGPDLSYLDDSARQKVEAILGADNLTPEQREDMEAVVEEMRLGYLRNRDYTQKRQTESQRVKEAEAYKADGQRWRDLLSDEGMMKHILAYGQQPEAGARPDPKTDIPEDLFLRDPKEVISFLQNMFSGQQADPNRLKEQLKSEVMNEFNAPLEHRKSLARAAEEWTVETGANEDTVDAACRLMVDLIGIDTLTPKAVQERLPKFVQMVESQTKAQSQAAATRSKQSTHRQARAASPRGGMGAAAPEAAGFDLRVKEKEEALGRQLTIQERSNLYFDMMVQSSGKSERELDEEFRRASRR